MEVLNFFQIDKSVILSYPMTMLAWFNADDNTTNETLLWIGDKDNVQRMTAIRYDGASSNDPVGAYSFNAAASFHESTLNTGGISGEWHQLVGVFASNTSRLVYLDGDPGTEDTNSSDATASVYDRTSIGHLGDSTPSGAFDGQISLAMIWDRALTQREIQELFVEQFLMFDQPLIGRVIAAADAAVRRVIQIN